MRRTRGDRYETLITRMSPARVEREVHLLFYDDGGKNKLMMISSFAIVDRYVDFM